MDKHEMSYRLDILSQIIDFQCPLDSAIMVISEHITGKICRIVIPTQNLFTLLPHGSTNSMHILSHPHLAKCTQALHTFLQNGFSKEETRFLCDNFITKCFSVVECLLFDTRFSLFIYK